LSARKTYTRTITAGDTLNFKTIVNDAEKDSVSISATGLADGMSFTGIKGLSPLERDFKWITNCALLGGVIAPKDYSVTFFVRDYKGCGNPKFDTIKVNLRLVPLPNPNPPRLYFTDSTTYVRNNVPTGSKREFNKFVKPNEVVNLDFTAIDLDKDVVIIEAVGEGFNLTDFGMKFTNVRGVAPQKTKFEWTPDCEILKRKQDFRVRFITQDQVVCRVTKADTIYINFKIEDVAAGRDFKDYNVFTPNGDGKNDKFSLDIPNDNCVDTFIKIEIYNRWGKLVYESNERNFAWEGSGFPAGLYYYYVQFKNKQYKNSVTLLRNE
jgi:gliding motility-associated-like protein